jgi:hypothetical protein
MSLIYFHGNIFNKSDAIHFLGVLCYGNRRGVNLKDTEAIQYMQNVIADSVGSLSGRLLDWAHEVELLIT